MITLSTITVPVLLDTTTHPPQLLHQWVRTYHYGHISLPTISIATAIIYFYIAARQLSRKKPWRKAALVGVLTVIMVPFTWVCMAATNDVLFGLQRESQMRDLNQTSYEDLGDGTGTGSGTGAGSEGEGEGDVATLEDVMELIVRWGWMHLVRSLFPLMAAVVGIGICV